MRVLSDLGGAATFDGSGRARTPPRGILQLCGAPVDRCTMPCTSAPSNATFIEKSRSTCHRLAWPVRLSSKATRCMQRKLPHIIWTEAGCLLTFACSFFLTSAVESARATLASSCRVLGRPHLIGPRRCTVMDKKYGRACACRNDTGGECGRGRDASRLVEWHGSISHHLNSIF